MNELKRKLIIIGSSCEEIIALDLLMIAKYFKGIGDHGSHIAAWVEFSLTGVHKDCQQVKCL